jgi:arachidonate 15-lipoxygenase
MAWIVIGACRGAVIGFVLGAIVSLGHLVFGDDRALRAIVAAFHSLNAGVGAVVGAILAAAAWLYWPSELSWVFRRSFWNLWGWVKFVGNKPANITRPPTELGNLSPKPLSQAIPDIPINSIKVIPENQIPGDERSSWRDRLASFLYKVQVWLYWAFSPMQPGPPPLHPIAADPQWALSHAYRWLQRKTFDPPDLPPEYEGSPDLGSLAVRGPYACYTHKRDDNFYQWDLTDLRDYACQDGLYNLGARVLFELDHASGRLIPYKIESALGDSQPANANWQLAKKLALCSVTTHLSLVRHFNWVHLASSAHLAVATRNCLPENHPLCRLLWPHIYGTQQSNDMVTRGQMVRGGDFETIFSFTYPEMCRLFEERYRDFKIVVNDPELDGISRGICGAGFDIPTQRNLEELFFVMHKHTTRYVSLYYQTDNEVKTNGRISKWLDWMNDSNHGIPNGVDVTSRTVTRASLARLLARFIYLVTVQHEMVGSFLWNYQLWTHRQPVRVYTNGQREPLDVYQRLVNANYNLNVNRRLLMDDFSGLALDAVGREAFGKFQSELATLQKKYENEPWEGWKMYPKMLKVNINA